MFNNMKYLIIISGLLLLACQEMPSNPDYSNPFDRENPMTVGEPFHLSAKLAHGGIALTWSPVAHFPLTGLVINRRTDPEAAFARRDTVGASDTTWVDTTVLSGHSYWYFVSAFNATEETRRTNVATIRINTAPLLSLNGNAEFTASRQVELTIIAALVHEMWVSHFADFSDGQWAPFANSQIFKLTTGAGEKSVFVKLKYSDDTESPVISAKITPLPMQPGFTIENGATSTPSRNVWLRNQVQGQPIEMRFTEAEEIQTALWQTYQDSLPFQLSTGAQPKTLRAQFKNDFEIESGIVTQSISPAAIQAAEIAINLGAKYTANYNVNLSLNVRGAQKIKISENPQFDGVAWQLFQSEQRFELSSSDGLKSLYFKFLNDFELASATFEQQIILDQTPPTAQFTLSPVTGITSETFFQFDATLSHDNLASDPELEVRWDWENSGIFTPWSSAKLASQNFQTGGEKNVRLQVRDAAGWTDSIARKVTVNTRPMAQFSVNPRVGGTTTIFQFDATQSHDPDGDNLIFRWDFDSDGFWETDWQSAATLSHQFVASGSYQVVLQLKDIHELTQTARKYLLVTEPTPMDWVPAGDFSMGSPAGVGDSDEQPPHAVYLDDFYIDKFEVSNLQFAEFLSAGHSAHFHPKMKIQSVEENFYAPVTGFAQHPVVYVNYPSAQAYAQWLGKALPTEAQWEKAARGTQARIYPWGNRLEVNHANYWKSGDPFETGAPPLTTPAGFYNGEIWGSYATRASHGPYGAFDLAGNVAEWCLDWYQADVYAQDILPNPSGPANGNQRVVRGGSWADDAYHLRSAARMHQPPYEGSPHIGFRCVKQ
jgi:formylglycine-generating enzyme required for sulfatase activity